MRMIMFDDWMIDHFTCECLRWWWTGFSMKSWPNLVDPACWLPTLPRIHWPQWFLLRAIWSRNRLCWTRSPSFGLMESLLLLSRSSSGLRRCRQPKWKDSYLQNGPSFGIILPSYFVAHLQLQFFALVALKNRWDQRYLPFIVVGWNGNPVVAKSFAVLVMLCLSLRDFFDKVHKGISFRSAPNLWAEDFSFVASFFSVNSGVSS